MTRALGRSVATAFLAALLGGAWAALFYAWHPALTIEFDREVPRNLSGVYGGERNAAAGLTFAWTGPDVGLRLPGLDHAKNWTLHLRVRGGRPSAEENPGLTILADGVALVKRPTCTGIRG